MTKIAIMGYGNLARGVECAIAQNPDMELAAVFTRRDPASLSILTPGVPVLPAAEAHSWKGRVDVMILCGGSATDLPHMTPEICKRLQCHRQLRYPCQHSLPFCSCGRCSQSRRQHRLDFHRLGSGPFLRQPAVRVRHLARRPRLHLLGQGRQPGPLRCVRRIPGVLDARQYTIPVPEALARVRSGENPDLTTREKHTRLCYVVAEDGADKAAIEAAIKTMPNYFSDYDTTVEFISMEEMKRDHSGLPHGGSVIRSGVTGWNKECRQTIEYQLQLDSNPQFTASVLVACARAAVKMHARGVTGCHTIFDIAPADLSPLSQEALLSHML